MKSTPALPLQQHPSFAAALGRLGQQVDIHPLPHAAPLLSIRRFGLRFASRGPIWMTDAPIDARVTSLRQSHLRLVNTDSKEPKTLRRAGFRLIHTAGSVAELDLTDTEGGLLTRAHGKWRNIWRRSQSSALRYHRERFAPHKHGWLLDADTQQQKQKGYRALPHSIIRAYAAENPKDVVVYSAGRKGTAIAGMLFLLHHPVATYHIGWTSAEARQDGAHHRMLMDAASHLAQRGFTRLDLGQVDTDTAPGLARFKIGTGAVIRPLGGTWLKIPGL
ncbi:GNAT family N-acetyltransferase [Yoonia sp. BS5-3]|uniref:GNAT family N-acetyltransferase n=1 Tax=Yoonia phaeophyticola TaxID=3137369 RepID=A0ABZ2V0T6_9RHOB